MSNYKLRFLADESCDFAVVRALRAEGYEVLAVAEVTTRSVDRELIEQAYREKRVLITEDKDFGWLVFVSHSDTAGVILIRFPGNARRQLANVIIELGVVNTVRFLRQFTTGFGDYTREREVLFEKKTLDEHIGNEGLLAGRPSGESPHSLKRWLDSGVIRPG